MTYIASINKTSYVLYDGIKYMLYVFLNMR